MPKARCMIYGATFDPATLSMLAELLDEVWAAVAAAYGNDSRSIEDARTQLATIIIDLARDGQLSPLQIAQTAARLMREKSSDRV